MSPIESLEIETLVVECGKSIQLFRLCQAIVVLLWSISPGFFLKIRAHKNIFWAFKIGTDRDRDMAYKIGARNQLRNTFSLLDVCVWFHVSVFLRF